MAGFIYLDLDGSLQEAGRRVARCLGLGAAELRENSTYVDEEYLTWRTLGLEVKMYVADAVGFERYRFQLSIFASGTSLSSDMHLAIADIVARPLAAAGWGVAVDLEDGGTKRRVYERAADDAGRPTVVRRQLS